MEKAKATLKHKLKNGTVPKKKKSNSDEKKPKKVYIPGRSRDLKKDEELICDESAYTMLHRFETVHPCLSFDTIGDNFGDKRDEYPQQCYLVAGTQAEKIRDNRLILMHLKNLHKRKQKEKKDKEDEEDDEESDSSSSDSDDDEEEREPILCTSLITHHGGVNRIRATNINESPLCAVWNDQGKVQIWNLAQCLAALDSMNDQNNNNNANSITGSGGQQQQPNLNNSSNSTVVDEKPLFSFSGHNSEGFALDWSCLTAGKLLSGDNRRNIHLWKMLEGGQWSIDQRPFNAHTSSVEDIQWSPTEDEVFASCSSDKSIRLWDTRVSPQQACVCTLDQAHEKDVNVLSWNSAEPLLLSGGDDGALKIWDLKFIQNGHPVAVFKHHTKPITSVHWYKHDSTVFAATGADNQATVWDLAVEPDDSMEITDETSSTATTKKAEQDVPPQLMFIHSGQEEMKEIRWHPQLCGTLITTALDGFNIFRPVNM